MLIAENEIVLLFFVFAFAEALEDGEAGFFGVGDGEGLEFLRGAEIGDDFADGFFAGGTGFEFGSVDGTAQSEFATANFAVTIDQFVFVKRHTVLET